MKKDIHPKYNDKVKVRCSCGAEFEIGSTTNEVKVEICSSCHPLYTGNKRFVDTAGRMDKFAQRMEKSKKIQGDLAKIRSSKKEVKTEETEETEEKVKDEKASSK